MFDMDKLQESLKDKFPQDVPPGSGLSLHDFCYEMGRRYGWSEVIRAIDNLFSGKGTEEDVPTPQDRIPADEYARRSSASG